MRGRRPTLASLTSVHRCDMSSSLSALPPELAEAVANFEGAVTNIEQLVERLQSANWPELCRGLGPLESARVHLMVAYTVNTLFYMYLKAKGISPVGHPVQGELERIKGYIKKLKAVSQENEKRGQAEQRQLTLNQGAASRFIAAALAPNSDTAEPAASSAEAGGAAAAGAGEGDSSTATGAAGTSSSAPAATLQGLARQTVEQAEMVESARVEGGLKASIKKLKKKVAQGKVKVRPSTPHSSQGAYIQGKSGGDRDAGKVLRAIEGSVAVGDLIRSQLVAAASRGGQPCQRAAAASFAARRTTRTTATMPQQHAPPVRSQEDTDGEAMQQLALETIAAAEAVGVGSDPPPAAAADARGGEGSAPKPKLKASASASASSKRPAAEGAGTPGKKVKKVKK